MILPSKSDDSIDKNDVDTWKPLALEARVRRGEVPVQEKFIRERAKRSTETTETVGTTPEDEEERAGGKTSGGFQKRTKKMNKAMTMKKGKRRNIGGEDNEEVQMCFQFLKNASCAKGETCRFSHDADYYRLKMKKKDLPGWCPFGSEKCPFGLACRFSGSHEDGFAPDDEDEAIALFEAPVANPRDDMNDVTNDVKYALARRTFDFSRADGILKAMGLRTSDEVRGGGGNSTNNRKNNDGKNQQQQKYKRMKTSENEKRVIAENADEYSDDDDDGNNNNNNVTSEPAFDKEDENKTASVDQLLKPKEKKTIDFKNKLYLAPLTTVGNLPFRRLCKTLGADIT